MERTVDILIEISIYSAVITAFILLFRAAFKKRISPKVQYAMWLLLVLRLMLPITIESGFHIESILPERPAPVVQEESIFESESPVISEIPAVNMAPVTEVAPVQPSLDIQGEEFTPSISQEIPESTVVTVPEVKEPIIDINWRIVAFWAWIAGAMAFGLWMMIVKLRFYEDMQQHTTSVSPRVYAIYDECCAALNVKPLTMWAVDRAISPGIAFFTYPVLLLPASMDGDEEKLRYAFLHELTHKKRHDHHMTALLTALRIIYWFNPAVHIGFSEMRADMETACDADVIAFVGKEQKRGYLSTILELFSYATRPQLGMSQASSRRMAKRRMKGAFMRERTTFLGRAAALMLAVIMLVGCFTTACQSAPAEVELKAANAVEVINHQQAWERFEDIFDSEVRGVIGFAQEYHNDLDGDGLADHAAFSGEGRLVTVELSSGGSINADAMELYEISRWDGDFLAMGQDLTGDGKNEVILLINSGGTSGDGQYLLYVYTVEGKEWKSMDTPASGFPVTVEWDCENIIVSRRFDTDFEPMEGGYSAIVADAETVQKYYAVMADREPWLELRDTPYTSDFAADAFCDIAVTSWRGEPVLAAAQYIAGPGGIHADRLGYFVSLIKWNDKGGYEVVDEFFASLRFALLSRAAKDADLINPDPIDSLSDMDLLTYAALEQGNGIYALPRTLTGNDLSLSIWDNVLLTVNDRYFDGKPYDAAGAAYNVVDVRRNEDGIIDVYLILTYRQYDNLNDKLSITGELNGAAIWHYKENENGEIEVDGVTWPEKDGDGYASSIKKNWPEDLQKYAEFSSDSIGRAERLEAIDEQLAIKNSENIGALLGKILENPRESASPYDYIHENVAEYGRLCAMGRQALIRFLPRFEKGNETGLEGQIMARVFNALTGIGLVYNHANGQEWYDANRKGILASEWVAAVQPTPAPTPTPAPATGEHAWRAGKLAIEPYRDNDTSRLQLSYYGITLNGNGTEQTESMMKDWFSNDVYSRDGQELLEVHRTPRGTLKLDVDLIQHSAENVQWNPDSETYGAVEYTPTWLPGHNDRVLRMTRRYERGTEDSIPYVTTIYSVQIQYNKSDVVLMFRFLNAKKINGEWQLYQTDYDCEKWMQTFQIDGAPNSIVARAESLVGKPYKVGAYGPDAFDSSGLVYYVVTQAGVYVEKLEHCQGYANNANWQKITDKADLQPGDILFFHGGDTEEIQHAGIYVGDGKMIDASSSHGKVTERSCDTDYWKEHFAFARRVA